MDRQKDYRIECLRVLSCFMVVCIHVSNYYSRGFGEISNDSYICSLLVNTCSRVAVPIFFMISGALLISEPLRIRKSIRRAWNTFVVLVIWSGIYYVWNLYYRDQSYDMELLFEEPVKRHLWFLYAILGMYIALPFLQCMFRNMPHLLMKYFTVLWAAFLVVNYMIALSDMEVTYDVPIVGDSCYLGYFVMGYIIRQFQERIRLSNVKCVLIAVACFAVIGTATYLESVNAGEHVEQYFEYRNMLIALASTMVFIAGIRMRETWMTPRIRRVFDFIARHSFTVYLSHILFLDVVKKRMFPRQISAWIGIPLFAVGVFAVSLAFSALLDYVVSSMKKRFGVRRNGKPAV